MPRLPGASGPSYVHLWYLKDHLGNNRVPAAVNKYNLVLPPASKSRTGCFVRGRTERHTGRRKGRRIGRWSKKNHGRAGPVRIGTLSYAESRPMSMRMSARATQDPKAWEQQVVQIQPYIFIYNPDTKDPRMGFSFTRTGRFTHQRSRPYPRVPTVKVVLPQAMSSLSLPRTSGTGRR